MSSYVDAQFYVVYPAGLTAVSLKYSGGALDVILQLAMG